MKMEKLTGEEVRPYAWNMATYASTKLQAMIDGFAESGERVVRLVVGDHEYASTASARGAVRQAIKAAHKSSYISVKQAHGNLFLLNELK